jgi:hypothetical protein
MYGNHDWRLGMEGEYVKFCHAREHVAVNAPHFPNLKAHLA